MEHNGLFGAWGEMQAAEYLRRKRYRLVAKNFRLRGGELVFQLLVLCSELVVFVDVAINALQPARGRGRSLLERGAQRAVQIRQESGAAAKTPHDDRGNEYHDQHERADADALFL